MKLTRFLAVLFCFGLLFAMGTSIAAAQSKIGVFDPQRLTQETKEGAKIQARLNAIKEKKENEIKKLKDELDKLQQDVVQKGTSLTEDKRKEMAMAIQRKQDELEGAGRAAQRELQMEVEGAQSSWQQRVFEIVNKFGKEKGFTAIFAVDAVLYFDPTIDVTQELMTLVDSVPTPAPAPAATPAPAPKPAK